MPKAGQGPRYPLGYEGPQPPRWARSEVVLPRSAPHPRALGAPGAGMWGEGVTYGSQAAGWAQHLGVQVHDGRCSSIARLCFLAPPVAIVTGKLRLKPARLYVKLSWGWWGETGAKGAEAPVLCPNPSLCRQMGLESWSSEVAMWSHCWPWQVQFLMAWCEQILFVKRGIWESKYGQLFENLLL